VSQEKWDKAKRLVKSLGDIIEEAGASIDGANLDSVELDY
jgi:hypothetical protein